jgi:3-oxoacyl-[acyl-carrier protein] reductase
VYAAAKAGLLGLTLAIAREYGSKNIRVNAVLPGVLPTGMTQKLSQSQREVFREQNVLGRFNDLAEVAAMVVFLCGTRNISGQVFQLDSRIAPWT